MYFLSDTLGKIYYNVEILKHKIINNGSSDKQ